MIEAHHKDDLGDGLTVGSGEESNTGMDELQK